MHVHTLYLYVTLDLHTHTLSLHHTLSQAKHKAAVGQKQAGAPCAPSLAAAHAPSWERRRSPRAREMPSRMLRAPFITIALEMRGA